MKFKFENPDKSLIPIFGSPGDVFLNTRPIKINSEFAKGEPEYYDCYYIKDQPLCMLGGMIYWFGIGDKQFDIREMRRKAGMKQYYKADGCNASPSKSLALVAKQLAKISIEQDLEVFLKPLFD